MVVDTLYLQLLGVIVPLVIAMLGVWQWRRDRAERLKITLHPWAAGVYPGTPALRDAIKMDVVNSGKVSVKLDQALLLTADGRQMVTPSSKGFSRERTIDANFTLSRSLLQLPTPRPYPG